MSNVIDFGLWQWNSIEQTLREILSGYGYSADEIVVACASVKKCFYRWEGGIEVGGTPEEISGKVNEFFNSIIYNLYIEIMKRDILIYRLGGNTEDI